MDLERIVSELQQKFAAAEEQHKTLFRRIEKAEKLTDSVNELALSVRDLVNAQQTTDRKLTGLCSDVAEIKAKPAKKWEALAMDVVKVVVGGVVGFLLVKLGLG